MYVGLGFVNRKNNRQHIKDKNRLNGLKIKTIKEQPYTDHQIYTINIVWKLHVRICYR